MVFKFNPLIFNRNEIVGLRLVWLFQYSFPSSEVKRQTRR